MKMKLYFILIFFIPNLLFSQKKVKSSKNFSIVKGIVNQTYSYCGGARPPDELLIELAKPKPLSNYKLYIKKNIPSIIDAIIMDSIITDQNGRFNIRLKKGNYVFIDSNYKDRNQFNQLVKFILDDQENYSQLDSNCLLNRFNLPLISFKINQRTHHLKPIIIHRNCDYNKIPCVNYKGPLPQ
jgi:hypothetical protein